MMSPSLSAKLLTFYSTAILHHPLQLRLQDKTWQLHQLPMFSLLTGYGIISNNRLNVRLFWLEMLSKFELQSCFQDDQVTATILDIRAE